MNTVIEICTVTSHPPSDSGGFEFRHLFLRANQQYLSQGPISDVGCESAQKAYCQDAIVDVCLQEKLAAAEVLTRQALQVTAGQSPDVLYWLGRILQQRGALTEAEKYLKASIAAAPNHKKAKQALQQVQRATV